MRADLRPSCLSSQKSTNQIGRSKNRRATRIKYATLICGHNKNHWQPNEQKAGLLFSHPTPIFCIINSRDWNHYASEHVLFPTRPSAFWISVFFRPKKSMNVLDIWLWNARSNSFSHAEFFCYVESLVFIESFHIHAIRENLPDNLLIIFWIIVFTLITARYFLVE